MIVGRNNKKAFAHYVDRIRSKLESLNFRFLSIGGKETLIKAFLQALPIYAMQCFLFPKNLCLKIENMLNNFCYLLAIVLKARYFTHTGFLSMGLSSYLSLTWRGIVSARNLLEKGMGWRIGDRETVNIWNDHWILRPGDGRLRC
ncbi:reverse transcriptase [Gossypium australe]|uniref:Reverse transcriptase n=1 Tax=Gossypium australe TaxID=47621 RepID=A0A5B6W6X7_9ROSI|nr:reverse transcriptase [Gossypium australe]